MSRDTPSRAFTVVAARGHLVLTLILAAWLAAPVSPAMAQAGQAEEDPAPVSASTARPDRGSNASTAHPARRRNLGFGAEGSSSGGWWFGTAGIGLILAACGGICLAAKRYLPQSTSPLLQVVGRVSLTPKHSVYLLRVEGRVLLVGAGPQGAPSLLAELDDTTIPSGSRADFFPEPEATAPARHAVPSPRTRPVRAGSDAGATRLDIRVGDEP